MHAALERHRARAVPPDDERQHQAVQVGAQVDEEREGELAVRQVEFVGVDDGDRGGEPEEAVERDPQREREKLPVRLDERVGGHGKCG